MELTFTQKKSIRKSFGKLKESLSIPNLIEVQKNSYNEFLKSKIDTKEFNEAKGLLRVFNSIFPINDASEKSSLEFISYSLEKPKFDVTECRQRSLTYCAAIKANLRLVIYEIDVEKNTKQILSAKEQEVFLGDIHKSWQIEFKNAKFFLKRNAREGRFLKFEKSCLNNLQKYLNYEKI